MNPSPSRRSPGRTALLAVAAVLCAASVALALVYPLNWTWVGPLLGAVAVSAYRFLRR